MQIIFKLHGSMTGSVGSERKRKICVGWGRGKWHQIVFYTRAPTILTIPLVPAIVSVRQLQYHKRYTTKLLLLIFVIKHHYIGPDSVCDGCIWVFLKRGQISTSTLKLHRSTGRTMSGYQTGCFHGRGVIVKNLFGQKD